MAVYSVHLTWDYVPDPAAPATAFLISRQANDGLPQQQIALVDGSVRSYTDGPLVYNTTYTYSVVATNDAGNSPPIAGSVAVLTPEPVAASNLTLTSWSSEHV